MNDEIMKVASKCGFGALTEHGEICVAKLYNAAFNAGLEAAEKCYSPDDLANDWMDKIRALEKAK